MFNFCFNYQVIKGLDQGIFGGEGVPPMQVGMLASKPTFLLYFVLCSVHIVFISHFH